ncbi:hypothetical protein AAHE18_13G028300 [Arachis hypogaea]
MSLTAISIILLIFLPYFLHCSHSYLFCLESFPAMTSPSLICVGSFPSILKYCITHYLDVNYHQCLVLLLDKWVV